MKHQTGWSPDDHEPSETMEGRAQAEWDASEEPSTMDVIRALIQDGREYAALEAERQKLRAQILSVGVRKTAILAGAAIFLLFGLLVAIPIGAIWILAPYVGPLAASAIVLVAGLVIILLLAQLAKAKFRSTLRKINLKE